MTKSASTSRASPSSKRRRAPKSRRRLRAWIFGVLAFLVVIGTPGTYFANKYWPYRYRSVEPMLETVFASRIKIDHYHRIYFPSPGFVASGLTLRRNTAPNLPPLGTARDLIVQVSWIDL